MQLNLLSDYDFYSVRDGNRIALDIANRHYSRIWKRGNYGATQPKWPQGKNSNRFVGPGQRLILLGRNYDWLFVWLKSKYRKDNQNGVNCILFRNEGNELSSKIILKCESIWDEVKGVERKFTYINANLIKSTNPGYCFKKAGWCQAGISQRGLILFEKLPPLSEEVLDLQTEVSTCSLTT